MIILGKRAAGFWIRIPSNILDGVIVGISLLILSLLIKSDTGKLITDIIPILYSLLLPIFWNGYTVGKKICGIKMTRLNGKKIGIGTMLLRNVVSGVIYTISLGICSLISAIMAGVREDKRAIHDFIASTQVIYNK